MVDSNDVERLEEAAYELEKIILTDETFPSPYLLLFCNKQDLPNARSVAEIVERLGLNSGKYCGVEYYAQPCCAITGEGIYEGLEWLGQTLAKLEK